MIYYRRLLHDKLVSSVSRNKVRLIFGARQVGKTVLLSKVIPEDRSVLYNLQDASVRRRLERDPSAFTRELQALPSTITHVFIDEIQKVPALLEEVQFLYDRDKSRFQFFLTGSSARKLRGHSANLLPGRSHLYHLFSVALDEEDGCVSRLGPLKIGRGKPFPRKSLHSKLIMGNLPGVREESFESAHKTLSAYVENYVEEEIRKEAIVRNTASFSIFLQLAALESGRQVNLTKISQESGIAVSTLKTYYQVLVDTFLGYWLHSYKKSSRKRLLTTPVFYFFDLGVRNAAAELVLNEALLGTVGGPLLEHLVGLELIQKAAYLGRGYNVSFWRTVSGAEVDFVFQTPEEDIPIEVKWTDNPTDRDARHVKKFLELNVGRAQRGYVVCRVPRAQQLSDNVLAIPFDEL
ncbi:MAG: ATP-binding protein [bacterium]